MYLPHPIPNRLTYVANMLTMMAIMLWGCTQTHMVAMQEDAHSLGTQNTRRNQITIIAAYDQEVADEVLVDSDEEGAQYIERLQRQLNERNASIERHRSKLCNQKGRATTLTSEIRQPREAVARINEDTRVTEGKIWRKPKTTCTKLGDNIKVDCRTCGKAIYCSEEILEYLQRRYPTRLFKKIRSCYNYFIFERWSWNHETYVSKRSLQQCFECMNDSEVERFLKQLADYEEELSRLSTQIEEDESKMERLVSDQIATKTSLQVYQRQEAKRLREKNAKVAAQARVAALEVQLAIKTEEAYTKEQLANAIMGASEEAEIAVKRKNDPKVYRSKIKRVGNRRLVHEIGEAKMPPITELQEPIEENMPSRDLQRIALNEDEATTLPPTAPTDRLQNQAATKMAYMPSSAYATRSVNSSISHSTRSSKVDQRVQLIARSLIRSNVSTQAICEATSYTPEQVASLRREMFPKEQEGPLRIIDTLPQELTVPRASQEDQTTTITSEEEAKTAFSMVHSLEPEELTAAENIAFEGWSFAETRHEDSADSQGSISRTILSSVHTGDNA
ncbi:MAG: hypothetical protein ACX93T_03405 [Bacteroidota bacterium]